MTEPTSTTRPLRVWTLVLPYTSPPLTMNDRLHRHARSRTVRQVRASAAVLARAHQVPRLDRIAVELHYVPRNAGRRDPINLAPTAKACEDGLVDAGVVPDDDPRYVLPTPAVIDPPSVELPPSLGACRLYLVVREVEPAPLMSDAAADAILDLAALDAELRGHQPKQWSPW